MMGKLLRLLPASLTAALARRAVPLAIAAVILVALVGVAAAALVSPGSVGLTAARVSETIDLGSSAASHLEPRDADRDGVSDALENYLYGTDTANWNSSGTGIPDGWLAQHRFDPLSPLVAQARGTAPPPEELPAEYADGYPAKYTPTLREYYAFGQPEGYRPGEDAPWWRAPGATVADPSEWDQSGTGIPTGWLVHYGIPPSGVEPDRVLPGSPSNLTLRQAFEHDTDPRKLDSDGDGLDDWSEINVHGTRPGRFSTAGTGIADGWLLKRGLDAFDATVASQDTDRDGLTNLEEFDYSFQLLGMPAVLTQGLDPLDWQTGKTGIPDGWYVKYGLSPFGTDVDRIIGKASDWPEYRAYVPEGKTALPDLVMTVRDAYTYGRPSDHDEARDGVWWEGTNPVTLDTDGDGMPDPVEIRGWYANVTSDTGPEARARAYLATSNPLEADSDGDGLTDLEEFRGRASCGDEARAFPPTNPRNLDTAFSGLTDLEKVCGAVRGDLRYDLHDAAAGALQLDPTKADSAGDLMRDGARLDHWHDQYTAYKANPRYPYNGSVYKTVFEWTDRYARFGGMSKDDVLAQMRPDGDVDGDGVKNVLDADPSGGLHLEKWPQQGAPRSKVLFPAGPEMDPTLYKLTEFASAIPHTASDPANPDTDGDGLPDAWEIRYGRYAPAAGGFDLDPAKADSDGDGILDADANNDGDVVTWYAFDRRGATSIQRTSNSFEFNNLLEFEAGTNPNDVSSAGDGVPDGWKAFWGSRITDTTFPSLLAARDPRVGGVALESAQRIETELTASPIQPLANLAGAGADATGYVRIVDAANITGTQTTGAAFLALLKPGEAYADPDVIAITTLDGRSARLAPIEGVYQLTYKREAELRTNPFMPDTDGDGAPDAYEAYYASRGAAPLSYPDPVTAEVDPSRDPDADGLTITGECNSQDNGATCGTLSQSFAREGVAYGRGADPNSADSDGDGIEDGIEVLRGFDPLDPADIRDFANAKKDDDRDGVPDFVELTASDNTLRQAFGAAIRTDPKKPDTDGDGLLDGRVVNLDPRKPADAAVIAWFNSLGIAHRPVPDDGTINYLGEVEFAGVLRDSGIRSAPDNAFSVDAKVPDGWFMYHLDVASNVKAVDTSAYAAFKPTWWKESAHGVWWWGRPPTDVVDDDLDNDGLHDASGEDPFPATLAGRNMTHGSSTLTNPRLLESFVASAGNASNVRERAQRVGDGAGDPRTARDAAGARLSANGIPGTLDRAQVAITLELPEGASLTKGQGFRATGRVTLDERQGGQPGAPLLETNAAGGALGVPGRTVLVSFFGPDARRIVGVGATGPDGRFDITANITRQLIVDVPADLPPFGFLNGTPLQGLDAGAVSAGTMTSGERNRVVAWVLNTSWDATGSETTYGSWKAWLPKSSSGAVKTTHATGFAVSAPIDVTVRSDTRLTSSVTNVVDNGRTLRGEIKLEDASGAPLIDRLVRLRWDGAGSPLELSNLTTDREGVVNVTNLGLLASVPTPGERSLVASFSSSDPYLNGTASTFTIGVRQPTLLVAEPERTSVTVGETLTVRGTLTTQSIPLSSGGSTAARPVPGAAIRVGLGSATETARTDEGGTWMLRLTVPGTLAPGPAQLIAVFDGTSTESPSESPAALAVKRTSTITGLPRLEGPRTIEVTLRGKLQDNEGQGFAGPIVVDAGGARVATGTANDKGAFAVVVSLGRLPLGSQQLRVTFPGDAGHAAAENLTQARVTSSTLLRMDAPPPLLVRGQPFPFHATLLDDFGQPVAQQPIDVHWRGSRVATLVTDAKGEVRTTILSNASERPGITQAAAQYVPGPTAVYQSSSAAGDVRVVQGTLLAFEAGSARRGSVTFPGSLVDDEGRPIPTASVTILLGGKPIGEERTSRNGSFEVTRVLRNDQPLGPITVKARYAGTSTLAGAEREVTWHVRTPLDVQLRTLGPFVRGETAPIEGRVVDDKGKPVDATVNVTLAGERLATIRVSNGVLKGAIAVPEDLPRGPTTVEITAPATPEHEAYSRTVAAIVKVRPKVDVALPALAVRGLSFGGDVTLTDDEGQPLRNTSFVYVMGKQGEPVLGRTDAAGRATLASVAPLSGDTYFTLTVRGGEDVVPAEYKTSALRVVGPGTPIGYAALAVGVLIVLAILALIVIAIILRRRQLEEVRDILDEAIRDLAAGNEYASTIFLAYRRLSAHLARHGFSEKESDTAREFAVGVRKALPLGSGPLKSLIQLFEEARYSDHAIGTRERDDAVRNLTNIRGELDRVLGKKGANA